MLCRTSIALDSHVGYSSLDPIGNGILGIARLAVLSVCLDVFFTVSWCDASEHSHSERNLRKPYNCFSATLKNMGDMKELENQSESGLKTYIGHPSYIELIPVYNLILELQPQYHAPVSAMQIDNNPHLALMVLPSMGACGYVLLAQPSPFGRAIPALGGCSDSPAAPCLKSVQLTVSSLLKEKKRILLPTVGMRKPLSCNLCHVQNYL